MAYNDVHQYIIAPPSTSMRHRAPSEEADGVCGEIVEVQGGHIVRSTGRKDRHSKVCTAKGPRDRRVRLSAQTAIQFYDVQDRLGFDRPSKAVDWLIKKAKTSIDKLAQLPPWNPADAIRNAAANAKPRRMSKIRASPSLPQQQPQNIQFGGPLAVEFNGGSEKESRFLQPPSMDSDSIAAVGSSTEAPPNQLMHNYHHHPPDLLSRTNSQNQDLRLSLQSFPNDSPSLLHNHHHAASVAEPVIFYGQSNPLGYDTSTMSWEQQSSELGRIQKLVAWNSGGATDTENAGVRFFYTPPPLTTSFQPVLGQSQLFSQRGPLQSSYTPMIRAWFDPHLHQSEDLNHIPPHQSTITGTGFASGELSSGFRIPARFQGQEEEHDGLTYKPSSTSRH